jgi:hypothetical protein
VRREFITSVGVFGRRRQVAELADEEHARLNRLSPTCFRLSPELRDRLQTADDERSVLMNVLANKGDRRLPRPTHPSRRVEVDEMTAPEHHLSALRPHLAQHQRHTRGLLRHPL